VVDGTSGIKPLGSSVFDDTSGINPLCSIVCDGVEADGGNGSVAMSLALSVVGWSVCRSEDEGTSTQPICVSEREVGNDPSSGADNSPSAEAVVIGPCWWSTVTGPGVTRCASGI
jgi:hypothetical protein